jgi:hypothetical protein
VPAAIDVVTPVVDKHHEAGETTSSVFYGELMAVPVADAWLCEVFGEPVGALEVTFEDLKICDLLGVHFWGGDRGETEAMILASYTLITSHMQACRPSGKALQRIHYPEVTVSYFGLTPLHSIPFRAYKALDSRIGDFIAHYTLLL